MKHRSVPGEVTPVGQIGIMLIGAGFIADAHSAAIDADPRATLVGIVDADHARAAAFAPTLEGIQCTSARDTGLAWPGVDAVIASTPNHTHAPIGLAVAAA